MAFKKVTGALPALVLLVAGFALSQGYRTLAAITVPGISAEFGASARELGLYAATFHLAFAAIQIPLGVALDRFGPRRVVGLLGLVSAAGAGLCAVAPSFPSLLLGQALIGVGCAPGLLGTMVFMSRTIEARAFARVSGIVFAAGGIGMLVTSTPLAWLVEVTSWRAPFLVLGALSLANALGVLAIVRDPPTMPGQRGETFGQALAGILEVLRQPQSAGLMALGLVYYGTAMTVRGLWIVPLFDQRWGFSLLASGNLMLAISIFMLVMPIPFGRADPGPARRGYAICGAAAATCATLVGLAFGTGSVVLDVGLAVLFAAVCSFQVLQYADVQSSYPPHLTGRAMAMYNMSVFLGVAFLQSTSGLVAQEAGVFGFSALPAVFSWLAIALGTGALLFALLRPGTERTDMNAAK